MHTRTHVQLQQGRRRVERGVRVRPRVRLLVMLLLVSLTLTVARCMCAPVYVHRRGERERHRIAARVCMTVALWSVLVVSLRLHMRMLLCLLGGRSSVLRRRMRIPMHHRRSHRGL